MSELDPKDVLADLFGEELPLDDSERVAEIVIERLRDAGFVIKPADEPGELGRLKDAQAPGPAYRRRTGARGGRVAARKRAA